MELSEAISGSIMQWADSFVVRPGETPQLPTLQWMPRERNMGAGEWLKLILHPKTGKIGGFYLLGNTLAPPSY